MDTPSNRLSHWEHAQKFRQHFWKRLQKEYLHQLLTRRKWKGNPNQDIQIETLVVMMLEHGTSYRNLSRARCNNSSWKS